MAKKLADKKPKRATLSEVVHFRLSKEDKEALLLKVELSGYSISEFVRQADIESKAVIAPAKVPRLRTKHLSTLQEKQILYLLQKQGANLNQLAHSVNAAKIAGEITPQLYGQVLQSLNALEQQANEVLFRTFGKSGMSEEG